MTVKSGTNLSELIDEHQDVVILAADTADIAPVLDGCAAD